MVEAIAFFLDPAFLLYLQSARMERGVVCSHCRWLFSVQHVTILWLWTKKTWRSHLRLTAKDNQHIMPQEADIVAVNFRASVDHDFWLGRRATLERDKRAVELGLIGGARLQPYLRAFVDLLA